MNKIVLEHYPVSKLPADVQRAVGDVDSVTLTIEADDAVRSARKPLSVDEVVQQARELATRNAGSGVTPEEAVRRIRELRDEWDD